MSQPSSLVNGIEYLDPTPVVQRTSLRMPASSILRTRQMIREELSRQALEQGQETFAEADDFTIDGEDPLSPYEEVFEPPLPIDSAPKAQEPASTAGAAAVPAANAQVDQNESA